jgi:diaminohydroxyphosphoribosylaminopyrimidine deaminase/5-amino-6-(5-phosphoribosylamino)uracil reductase
VLGTAELIGAPRAAGGLDLDFVLRDLKRRGIDSILVEGGGTVHRSLLDLDVVDEVHLFVAPIALAGGAGWLGGAPRSLGSVRRWRLVDVRRAGPDAWLVLQP